MQIYDTHVHTIFSADGISTLEEYAAVCRVGSVKGIGFTEHIDFMPWGGSYGFLDPAAYIAAVHAYQRQGYAFYAGAEIDYDRRAESEIRANIQKYHYAYTIGSVHPNGLTPETDEERLWVMIQFYYDELRGCISMPELDVIGHIGLYRRYLGRQPFSDPRIINSVNDLDDEMARLCARSGKILEINTSGLFAPLSATIPDAAFARRFYEYGGRRISVGSDAHRSAHLTRGFEMAFAMLREIGFDSIMLPWDKEKPLRL